MFKPRYYVPIGILAIGAAIGLGWSSDRSDTAEQLKKLEEAFLIINKRYVEDVEPAELAETAIEAMIASLDPHSSYIDAEAFVEVNESYQGSFGGIGIWFEIPRSDTAQVVSAIEGGPSERVGLRAGDRIIAVDDSTLVGADDAEVRGRLKGPVGTKVKVTVKRLGIEEPLDFVITRDQIPLFSVASRYMVDDQTGYMKISRFAQTTHREFAEGVMMLRDEGMERLILDLRDNPGGIMEAAAAIVDEMLAGNGTIVQTHGRAVPSQRLPAGLLNRPGILEEAPVIVLVNHNSVSASEIVAGALQDHDRALIVGDRTYGKGLVQNQFQLPDDSRLQMTTARYYTPSGRLIQTPYEDGDHEAYIEEKVRSMRDALDNPEMYFDSIPDSLKYTTTHGRTVFGGGGIYPDHRIEADTLMSPVLQVMYRGFFFEAFRDWFTRHEQALRAEWEDREAEFEAFAFTDAQWAEFWDVAAEAQVAIAITDNPAEASLEDRVIARADAWAHRESLQTYLKGLLARQLYGSRAAYPYYNQVDRTFLEALALWDEAAALPALTSVSH